MSEEVHYIPVGFDLERLVQPLYLDDFDVDRVVLLHYNGESSNQKEADIAEDIVSQIKRSIESGFGINVEIEYLSDMFDYKELFKYGYDRVSEELQEGNEVFLNISSMPRTVAFALATAANTHIAEDPELRNQLHTYYTSPESYLMTDVVEVLEKEKSFLEENEFKRDNQESVQGRLEDINTILASLQKGTTSGVRELPNGKHHVEFISPPVTGVKEEEGDLLRVLDYMGKADSISALARTHADWDGDHANNTYITKIRNRVENLEEKGLVERKDRGQGKQHPVELSRIGRMWATTRKSLSESDFE